MTNVHKKIILKNRKITQRQQNNQDTLGATTLAAFTAIPRKNLCDKPPLLNCSHDAILIGEDLIPSTERKLIAERDVVVS